MGGVTWTRTLLSTVESSWLRRVVFNTNHLLVYIVPLVGGVFFGTSTTIVFAVVHTQWAIVIPQVASVYNLWWNFTEFTFKNFHILFPPHLVLNVRLNI